MFSESRRVPECVGRPTLCKIEEVIYMEYSLPDICVGTFCKIEEVIPMEYSLPDMLA